MTITVIGATGRSARWWLAGCWRRAAGADPGPRPRQGPRSARPRFPSEIITGDRGTPADLEAAFQGADAAYVALGSIGLEGNLGRLTVLAAGAAPPCRSSSGCGREARNAAFRPRPTCR